MHLRVGLQAERKSQLSESFLGSDAETRNETLYILRDIKAYVRIQAAVSLRELAKTIISVREKADVFSRMDGTKTHKELNRLVGVPRKTVTNWVGEFVQNGLAIDVKGSNDRALFTLRELNINPSALKKRGSKSEGNG